MYRWFVVLVSLWAGPALAQEKSPAASSLLQEGSLNKTHKQLEQVFTFTFDGPRLKIDRRAWGEDPKEKKVAPNPAFGFNNVAPPIEQIFNQLRSAAGGLGGSSMTISQNDREVRFYGNVLSARVHTRMNSEWVRLDIEEMAPPKRSLEFQDDGRGTFRLLLIAGDGDILNLHQTATKFTVVGMIAGEPVTLQGDSFLTAYRQHRAIMDKHVLPVLSRLAIKLLMSPNLPEVQKAVQALVTRTPETLVEGKKLLGELDSEKFNLRERASRGLNDRYEVYKDLIADKMKEKNLSTEMIARLQKIQAAHPDSQKVGQTIAALDLMNDAGYLVSLFATAPAEDHALLAGHLEKVTGQKLGTDQAAWKKWLESQKR